MNAKPYRTCYDKKSKVPERRASFWLKDNEKMLVKSQKAKTGEVISQNEQRLKSRNKSMIKDNEQSN